MRWIPGIRVAGLLTASLVLSMLVLVMDVTLIQSSPLTDLDESSLLIMPFRAANYGDAQYRVYLEQAFNSQQIRKQPPPLTFALRDAVGTLTGFSARTHRLISVAFVFGALVAGVLVAIRLAGPTPLALTPFVLIGLHPTVLSAARSVRFEQEILFLVMVAGAACPLALRRRHPQWNGVLWALSGAAAGVAAMSHPLALAVPLTLLAVLAVYRRSWQELDGLRMSHRLIWWIAGLAIPLGAMAGALVYDWSAWYEYVKTIGPLYSGRELSLLADYPALAGWLPERIGAKLAEGLIYTDLYAWHDPIANWQPSGALAWAFGAQLVVVLGFLVGRRGRTTSPHDAYLYTVLWLLVGLLVSWLAYPPNTNYGLYQAFLVPLVCALVVARLWSSHGSRAGRGRTLLRVAALATMLLSAVPSVLFSAHLWERLHEPEVGRRVSLDTYFSTLRTMAAKLGLDGDRQRLYCDVFTWPACGRRMGSYSEVIELGLARPSADTSGAIFARMSAAGVGDGTPDLAPHIPGGPSRRDLLRAMLGSGDLAGLMFQAGSDTLAIQFYGPEPRTGPIRVAVIDDDATVQWGHLVAAAPVPVWPAFDRMEWALDPGRYVLCVRGQTWTNSTYSLALDHGAERVWERHPPPLIKGTSLFVPDCTLVDVAHAGTVLTLISTDRDGLGGLWADLFTPRPDDATP